MNLTSLLIVFAILQGRLSSVIFDMSYFNAYCLSILDKENHEKKSFIKLRVRKEGYQTFETFFLIPKHLYKISNQDCNSANNHPDHNELGNTSESLHLDLKITLLVRIGSEEMNLEYNFRSIFVDNESFSENLFFKTVFRSSLEMVPNFSDLKECLDSRSYDIRFPYESVYLLSTEVTVHLTLVINCFTRR